MGITANIFWIGGKLFPSAFSSGTHGYNPVEQDANARAFTYFNGKYSGFADWNFTGRNPNTIIGYNHSLPYEHEDNQLALKKAKLGLSWYDWVMSPMNILNPAPVVPGLVNTLILNSKY